MDALTSLLKHFAGSYIRHVIRWFNGAYNGSSKSAQRNVLKFIGNYRHHFLCLIFDCGFLPLRSFCRRRRTSSVLRTTFFTLNF